MCAGNLTGNATTGLEDQIAEQRRRRQSTVRAATERRLATPENVQQTPSLMSLQASRQRLADLRNSRQNTMLTGEVA